MLRVLKNKVERVLPQIGLNDITGSGGLGINTPKIVKKAGDIGIDIARAQFTGDYKGLADKYGPQVPGMPDALPTGSQPVNAKSFGNTSYSENSLYKEGLVPGSIDAQSYKK